MAQAGLLAYLGDIEVNYGNLYLGENNSFINPSSIPTIPKNGLIAVFDATNPSSYPGTGNYWYDLTTNGLVATTFSSSTFPSFNSVEKGLEFNGTSNAVYAYISSSVATGSIISNFTQVAWLKLQNTTSGNERGFVNLQNTAPSSINFDAISFNQSNNSYRLTSAFADRNVTPNVTETVFNEYMMVVATRTAGSGNFKIYRQDGQEVGNGSFQPVNYSATAASGLAVLMGQRFFNNTNATYPADGYWSGSMSSMIMYNRALSQSEIQTIYYAGRFGIKV
jgi:Concanavalin A-like lectin/glucanases superfamily